MDPVVHFEMPYEDSDRMADFYAKTFGWKAQKLGAEMGNYVVVHTGETDGNNMLQKPGMINGGFFKRSKPDQSPSFVIAVQDIEQAMKKIEAGGGKVLGGSSGKYDDIPGVGLYSSFLDSEGNRVGILQPKNM